LTKEGVLLADDFGANLEDRLGPFVQRLDQPIRGLPPLKSSCENGTIAYMLSETQAALTPDCNF